MHVDITATAAPAPDRDRPAGSARPSRYLDVAARSLSRLTDVGPMGLWAATRAADGQYTALRVTTRDGESLDRPPAARWADSVCFRMVKGIGPRVTPDIRTEPGYADSVLGHETGTRGYAGAPVVTPNGMLVGSLCGVSFAPLSTVQLREVARWRSVVEAHADLLGVEFQAELDRMDEARDHDRDDALRSRDKLTGLPDRRGWALLLTREDERCAAVAEPLGVVVVSLDGARTARALRRGVAALREVVTDDRPVVRLGGRQFGVLAPGSTTRTVRTLSAQVEDALGGTGLRPTSGWAMRADGTGACGAWRAAEQSQLVARRVARMP
ncbi:hypothetical protein SAMN05443575_3848 [Jatrophihabitans endophyticus]|uniref:GGDEF domain-containing protein n=1 Tax=Jatrophihabitans endophyticus TaxID=1206085 RepID=A0A1M5SWY7_9ACTN|nr:GGDEF domain-containing protein [Jatrophihabitans endophyticus]SHH43027.1 hypothetical protein SAMN05443575_3848 [Jatrophihabitans endophyticus]